MNLTPLEPWISQKIGQTQPGLTRSELETWELACLNDTLALARTRSAFYRKHLAGLPETLTSPDELAQFPFTTPDEIRRGPLSFVCVSQDDIQRVVTLQSSGTTGEPKRIFFTGSDQELTIDFFGVGMSTFTQPGERVLILLPGETPGSVGDLLRQGLERLPQVQPIPHGPVRDPMHTLEVMNSQQVDCLVGSPTQILGLALRWQPGIYKPGSVLLSTDYLPAAIVKQLVAIWDCRVFDHYGTTEMGLGGGVECEAHRGYHLREADMLFEIVDPLSGAPLPAGAHGEVVFTTLTRRGMPLIRYRMGDRSRFLTGACPCGTALKTLEKISGRFGGFVSIGSEVLCLPDFDEALFAIPGLLNFTMTVSGEPGREILAIETQMLSDLDATAQVEQALQNIPAARNLKVSVRSRYNPGEPGSILKRTILDKRGQNA